MIQNYILTAWRNLVKARLYSAINILGLAIGLASCMLILLFVKDELNWDSWIDDGDRVVRIHSQFDVPGRAPIYFPGTPGPLLPAMAEEFPEIEAWSRVFSRGAVATRGSDTFSEEFDLVDPGFFDILSFNTLSGDLAEVLEDVNSIAISEDLAEKYFGQDQAVGQTLRLRNSQRDQDFKVAAVFQNIPASSTISFGIIALFEPSLFVDQPWVAESWGSVNASGLLKLAPGTDISALNQALPAFEKRIIPDQNFGGRTFAIADFVTFTLSPVADWHLKAGSFATGNAGSMTTVVIFISIALMILLIACINFMNLATARAGQRAREVALRKTLGARRQQLIGQFLGESLFMAFFSLLLAFLFVELVLPAFRGFLERDHLAITWSGADSILPSALGLIILVGLFGGLYPATYLSGFRPAKILKANRSSDGGGSGILRQGLVVLQFAISIGLIVCTGVVYGQYSFAQNSDLGFERENRLILRGLWREDAVSVKQAILDEIVKLPGVTQIATSSDIPGDNHENNNPIRRLGDDSGAPIVIGRHEVDWDYMAVYGLEMVAGRRFSREFGQDQVDAVALEIEGSAEALPTASIILNEAASRRLGFSSPGEAVGQTLLLPSSDTQERQAIIVGVVADAKFQSVRVPVRPVIFERTGVNQNTATIAFQGVRGAQLLRQVEDIWRDMVPGVPFNAEFLDENLAEQYRNEAAQATMFAAFAGLAIIVACLGLYGLASFTAERRTKEIGIRKVMGAAVADIVTLLLWQFSKPVLIANLIAWPVAFYLMTQWLSSFEFRIGLNPLLFLGAGLVALLIAWVTVSAHAARVARSNPVKALRYE